jgi:hypothetical protein
MRFHFSYLSLCIALIVQTVCIAQTGLWHGLQRKIHYKPDGEDFLLVNGDRRFNRALYGGNSAFRVEAGDLPEFALYLPGMGGNLKFGLINDNRSKWLINADKIEARYRAGSMIYQVGDSLLGKGSVIITVLSLFQSEGLIVRIESKDIGSNIQLVAAYGGATGLKFSRDGDIGADPESSFFLKPEYCSDNVYAINKNQFTVYFGSKKPLTDEERYEIQNFPNQKKDAAINKADLKSITGIFPAVSHLKLSDAAQQQSPIAFYQSNASQSPAICAALKMNNEPFYFLIQNDKVSSLSYEDLASLFEKTESTRKQLAGRIKLNTPDPYINTLGGALSMAADAIFYNNY